MNELKTLKDIEDKFKEDIKKASESGNFIVNSMLVGANISAFESIKTEAIKCAKYFKKKLLMTLDTYWKGRFDEVMERNNLTESDLEKKK